MLREEMKTVSKYLSYASSVRLGVRCPCFGLNKTFSSELEMFLTFCSGNDPIHRSTGAAPDSGFRSRASTAPDSDLMDQLLREHRVRENRTREPVFPAFHGSGTSDYSVVFEMVTSFNYNGKKVILS